LAIDDGSSLHEANRILDLLKDNGSEEMRLRSGVWVLKESFSYTHDIVPKWLPLTLLVPDITALKERNNQALRLHED